MAGVGLGAYTRDSELTRISSESMELGAYTPATDQSGASSGREESEKAEAGCSAGFDFHLLGPHVVELFPTAMRAASRRLMGMAFAFLSETVHDHDE